MKPTLPGWASLGCALLLCLTPAQAQEAELTPWTLYENETLSLQAPAEWTLAQQSSRLLTLEAPDERAQITLAIATSAPGATFEAVVLQSLGAYRSEPMLSIEGSVASQPGAMPAGIVHRFELVGQRYGIETRQVQYLLPNGELVYILQGISLADDADTWLPVLDQIAHTVEFRSPGADAWAVHSDDQQQIRLRVPVTWMRTEPEPAQILALQNGALRLSVQVSDGDAATLRDKAEQQGETIIAVDLLSLPAGGALRLHTRYAPGDDDTGQSFEAYRYLVRGFELTIAGPAAAFAEQTTEIERIADTLRIP